MTHVPDYIDRRIRRSVPFDSCVVLGSTPVVSFGNARTAAVATLGLNPSRIEFIDSKGREWVGSARRLATHRSLGNSSLVNAPSEIIASVLGDCNQYFERNPYRKWFDQLEPILNACGASYYAGSACHLDLVQWATDPTWSNLRPAALKRQLIHSDAPFLYEQLSRERIRLLLVNGKGVVDQLRRIVDAPIDGVESISGFRNQDTRLFAGTILDRVHVIGWSTNVQSSFGVTRGLRTELAARVARLLPGSLHVPPCDGGSG